MGVITDMLPSILPLWLPRGVRDLTSWAGKKLVPKLMYGDGVAAGAAPLPYAIENVRVDYVADDPGIPVGFWRSVSNSATAFVVECFLDEIAVAGGRDPLELRLALLDNDSFHRTVLELAAREADWGTTPDNGLHRGLAVHEFDETFVAMVAEISIEDRGRISVERVTCGVDCGRVLNPRIVKTQIASAIAFGLTATLKGEITIDGGRVREGNVHDFPILTMAEMPEVEVHLVDTDRRPSGIGECGVPPIAPAVANAVFAATGERLRRLPLGLG
jgi:CO/xanthine dehydrogenase Mo-binding subunit